MTVQKGEALSQKIPYQPQDKPKMSVREQGRDSYQQNYYSLQRDSDYNSPRSHPHLNGYDTVVPSDPPKYKQSPVISRKFHHSGHLDAGCSLDNPDESGCTFCRSNQIKVGVEDGLSILNSNHCEKDGLTDSSTSSGYSSDKLSWNSISSDTNGNAKVQKPKYDRHLSAPLERIYENGCYDHKPKIMSRNNSSDNRSRSPRDKLSQSDGLIERFNRLGPSYYNQLPLAQSFDYSNLTSHQKGQGEIETTGKIPELKYDPQFNGFYQKNGDQNGLDLYENGMKNHSEELNGSRKGSQSSSSLSSPSSPFSPTAPNMATCPFYSPQNTRGQNQSSDNLARILEAHRELASEKIAARSRPNFFLTPLSNTTEENNKDLSYHDSPKMENFKSRSFQDIHTSSSLNSPLSDHSGTPLRQSLRLSLSSLFKSQKKTHDPLTITQSLPNERLKARRHSFDGVIDTNSPLNSDEDEDDYGFRNHPDLANNVSLTQSMSSCSSAMQKAKSPSQVRRILPKKWRKSKTGGTKNGTSVWKPEGPCTWISLNGRKVVLQTTCLQHLSDMERLALHKIAVAKLQAMDLGCTINIPKEWNPQKRSKRSAFSIKRRTNTISLLENFKDRGREKESKDANNQKVFGIPLGKCIANDIEVKRRKPSLLKERREGCDTQQSSHIRKSSSSSVSSPKNSPTSHHSYCYSSYDSPIHSRHKKASIPQSDGGAVSSDSLSGSDASREASSNLLEALSLQSSTQVEYMQQSQHSQHPSLSQKHIPQVPFIVSSCFKHLETYGLRVLGIFRIGCSKKRTKMMREEFDSGKDVKLNEEHSPHDVGGLLKEYFRDLPDALLTKDLYNAFLCTRKYKDKDRRLYALRLLISLLPVANRDTLWALLRFLQMVVQHSTDVIDENQQELPGNKMDSHNLATLFGPNILHKAKGGEFEVMSMERAEERKEVINVVQELIENHEKIFQIPAELHDDVLRYLQGSNPDAVDILLKRKCAAFGIDIDPESSSFYEESDTSSIPHSPSSETEVVGQPRSFTEALALHQQGLLPSPPHKHLSRVRTEPSPIHGDTLRVPGSRQLSNPESFWYGRSESRTPSPRVSPCPKAIKTTAGTPDLRIRITPDSPKSPRSTVGLGTHWLVSPKPTRARKQPQATKSSSSIPSAVGAAQYTLAVPPRGHKTSEKDMDSSSIGSYNPISSRSGTSSPTSPTSGHRWGSGTPPAVSKDRSTSGGFFSVLRRGSTGSSPPPDARTVSSPPARSKTVHSVAAQPPKTSSQHRPLGFTISTSSEEDAAPRVPSIDPRPRSEWQEQRWRQWERLAKEHNQDFHEQETLV